MFRGGEVAGLCKDSPFRAIRGPPPPLGATLEPSCNGCTMQMKEASKVKMRATLVTNPRAASEQGWPVVQERPQPRKGARRRRMGLVGLEKRVESVHGGGALQLRRAPGALEVAKEANLLK